MAGRHGGDRRPGHRHRDRAGRRSPGTAGSRRPVSGSGGRGGVRRRVLVRPPGLGARVRRIRLLLPRAFELVQDRGCERRDPRSRDVSPVRSRRRADRRAIARRAAGRRERAVGARAQRAALPIARPRAGGGCRARASCADGIRPDRPLREGSRGNRRDSRRSLRGGARGQRRSQRARRRCGNRSSGGRSSAGSESSSRRRPPKARC